MKIYRVHKINHGRICGGFEYFATKKDVDAFMKTRLERRLTGGDSFEAIDVIATRKGIIDALMRFGAHPMAAKP